MKNQHVSPQKLAFRKKMFQRLVEDEMAENGRTREDAEKTVAWRSPKLAQAAGVPNPHFPHQPPAPGAPDPDESSPPEPEANARFAPAGKRKNTPPPPRKPAPTPPRVAKAAGGPARKAASTPTTYEQAVHALMDEGVSRTEAMKRIAKQNPALYQDYLARWQEGKAQPIRQDTPLK